MKCNPVLKYKLTLWSLDLSQSKTFYIKVRPVFNIIKILKQ